MSDRPDVFISYSRKDSEWVKKSLYEPLCRCRRRIDDQRPDIFLDTSREQGIPAGVSFRDTLAYKVNNCKKFIAVLSPDYIESRECTWEFGLCFNRDPDAADGIIVPVMIEPCKLFEYAMNTQFIAAFENNDWFARLCDSLRFTAESEKLFLQFITQPCTVHVNETLPAVRVQICDESGTVRPTLDAIRISGEHGKLQGESIKHAKDGVVEFDDISLGKPIKQTRLVAEGTGFKAVFSQPFRVNRPAPTPTTNLSIRAQGRPMFFARGSALAVIAENSVTTFRTSDQTPLMPEPLQLNGRLRLTRLAGDALVLADWDGYVYILRAQGSPQVVQLGDPSRTLNVVGDVAAYGDDVLAGLWSGEVIRVSMSQNPQVLLRHAGGVQALATSGKHWAIASLDGFLSLYSEQALINKLPSERIIRLIKPFAGHYAVIGQDRMYQVPFDGKNSLTEDSLLNQIVAVYGECPLPIAINRDGRGMFLNGELANYGDFRTTPSAVPSSADDAGKWCVFHNPDGLHSLMHKPPGSRQGRFIRSWESSIAVNPAGNLLAVSEEDSIRLLQLAELLGS